MSHAACACNWKGGAGNTLMHWHVHGVHTLYANNNVDVHRQVWEDWEGRTLISAAALTRRIGLR